MRSGRNSRGHTDPAAWARDACPQHSVLRKAIPPPPCQPDSRPFVEKSPGRGETSDTSGREGNLAIESLPRSRVGARLPGDGGHDFGPALIPSGAAVARCLQRSTRHRVIPSAGSANQLDLTAGCDGGGWRAGSVSDRSRNDLQSLTLPARLIADIDRRPRAASAKSPQPAGSCPRLHTPHAGGVTGRARAGRPPA